MPEEVKKKKKRNKPRHPEKQAFYQLMEDQRLQKERLEKEPPGPGGYAALAAAGAAYEEACRVPHPPKDRELWLAWREAEWRYGKAFENAFPLSFGESVRRLQAGDASGLEDVVAHLEADPIYEGAGFQKEGLIRLLHGVTIPQQYLPRLQAAVLTVVDHRHWRDFRDFCRLAKLVDGPALREQLTQRLESSDPDIKRRAQWVLDALAQKDSMARGKQKSGSEKAATG